jgi:TRAP-type C4-dicarboxylate transport system permease small subunit
MNRFIRLVEWAAAAFMFLVAIGIAVSVLLRKLFSWAPPDYFDLARLILGVALFWGIASACYRNRHILVDVIYELCGTAGRRWMDIVATATIAIFMALTVYMLGDATLRSISSHLITTELRIPIWIFQALCWFGTLAGLVLTCVRLQRLFKHRDTMHEGESEAA